MRSLRLAAALAASTAALAAMAADRAVAVDAPPQQRQAANKLPRTQVGKASIYASKFANRKMANGRRMDPNDDNAASKTLPLGTQARVTNLETGRSAVVTIEDRGPHVRGRIVDLPPATAGQIGLTRKEGIAPVEVTPLHVPGRGP